MRKNEGLQDLLVHQQFIGVKITRDMVHPSGGSGGRAGSGWCRTTLRVLRSWQRTSA